MPPIGTRHQYRAGCAQDRQLPERMRIGGTGLHQRRSGAEDIEYRIPFAWLAQRRAGRSPSNCAPAVTHGHLAQIDFSPGCRRRSSTFFWRRAWRRARLSSGRGRRARGQEQTELFYIRSWRRDPVSARMPPAINDRKAFHRPVLWRDVAAHRRAACAWRAAAELRVLRDRQATYAGADRESQRCWRNTWSVPPARGSRRRPTRRPANRTGARTHGRRQATGLLSDRIRRFLGRV